MMVSNKHSKQKGNTGAGMTLEQKAATLRRVRGSIKELARELGVSHTTVSLAADGKLPISPAALRRYLDAIDRKVAEILRREEE